MMESACPGAEELAGFEAGRADEDRIDTIGRHLETCEQCQARLMALPVSDPLSALLRSQTVEIPHSGEDGFRLVNDWANRWAMTTCDFSATPTRERPHLQPADPDTTDLGRLGTYRILSELGEGGMAVVYDALDTRLQRPVALKVLKPYWASAANSKQRFLREARANANLHDDHIVPIYDVGEVDGVPFIAMARLHGQTLESRLRATKIIPLPELMALARQMTAGLVAAHAHGLIHRDIKPANIWIEQSKDEGGRRKDESEGQPACGLSHPSSFRLHPSLNVKLLDFGLARSLSEDSRVTQTGIVVGTPAYMAPEQASGGPVDPRGDLFSLGCVLYRMATGMAPFPGNDTLAVFWALASKDPVPPRQLNPEIPAFLAALILKLLAKEPAQRPASAEAVLAALNAPTEAGPRRWSPIHVGLAGAALLAVGIASAMVFQPRRELAPAPAAVVPAASGFALNFDGTGLVEIDDFPLPPAGPYTLEAYATVHETKSHRHVVVGAGTDGRVLALEISSFRQPAPTWRFSWRFPYAIGEARIERNRRVHLAATLSDAAAVLFVDGKRNAAQTQPTPCGAAEPISLKVGHNFFGTIDQVRISKTCRYDTDFTPAPVLAPDADTLAIYRFDEGQGDILHDASGHGRHGKIVGATWAAKSPLGDVAK